ncbi:MAG: hypothetical protein ACJ8AO_03725 [Gemmatimonadaceae bacterium]
MTNPGRAARAGVALAALAALGACSSAGSIGDILGGVLGGGGGQQVQGAIRGVDTRNQQITLQQSNGENVALRYDNNTRVVYQSQVYAVGNLEYGDEVVARVLNNNGGYYTDSITVTRSVNGTGTTTSGDVRSIQGTVRQIDRQNGVFTVDVTNGALTVALPYNVSSADLQRFQNLRSGDNVRFYGVYLNNSRVELRQFQ